MENLGEPRYGTKTELLYDELMMLTSEYLVQAKLERVIRMPEAQRREEARALSGSWVYDKSVDKIFATSIGEDGVQRVLVEDSQLSEAIDKYFYLADLNQ